MIVTLLIISGVLILILGYVCRNLHKKNEIMEDTMETQQDILAEYLVYLTNIATIIKLSDQRLKELDHKGSFKSDDEVGFFFDQISQIQGILNEFDMREIKDTKVS